MPDKPDPENLPMAPWLTIEHPRRRVADLERWARSHLCAPMSPNVRHNIS